MGYSPWGCKQSDTILRLNNNTHQGLPAPAETGTDLCSDPFSSTRSSSSKSVTTVQRRATFSEDPFRERT